MNTKTILNIKTEKSIKKSAQKAAEEIGVPLSTVINAFLKQFARDKEITFTAAPKPSKYLKEILHEAERDLALGKTKGPFLTVKEMMKSLEKK